MIIDKPTEAKERILGLLRMRGPSLTVPIAKAIGQNSIFTAAFLSELIDDRKVKISHMRVGSSPIYYLAGQENDLEKFSQYLPGKEREALALLKEKRFLKDSEQHPAIRVALRSMRDFAFSLIRDKEVYWRHVSVPEGEFESKIEPKIAESIIDIKPEIKIERVEDIKPEISVEEKKPEIKIEIKEEVKPEHKIEIIREEREEVKEIREKKIKKKPEKKEFELKIFEEKPAKEEKVVEKSEFVKKIEEFLDKHNFKIVREIEAKKKEYYALIETESKFGKTGFLCIAKDKKSVSDEDLKIGLQKSSSEKSPLLFVSPGDLNKKGKMCADEWRNLIKFMKLE